MNTFTIIALVLAFLAIIFAVVGATKHFITVQRNERERLRSLLHDMETGLDELEVTIQREREANDSRNTLYRRGTGTPVPAPTQAVIPETPVEKVDRMKILFEE